MSRTLEQRTRIAELAIEHLAQSELELKHETSGCAGR